MLRRLRMRSLAAIRGSVEPVSQEAYARFLPEWQHVTRPLEGIDGVAAVVEQLAGVPIPASAWESLVLPARVSDYAPAMLDELTATGEVVWSGHGSLPGRDGWIALHPADALPLTLSRPRTRSRPGSLEERSCSRRSRAGGAYFAAQLRQLTGAENEQSVVEALWSLTWAGRVTNDTFAPVRTLVGGGSQAHRVARKTPRARLYRGAAVRTVAAPSAAAARDRRTLVAAARRPNPTPRCARPRPRACCSTATASSRGARCRPRACPAASRRPTACSPASKRPATAAGVRDREARRGAVRGIRHRRPAARVRRAPRPAAAARASPSPRRIPRTPTARRWRGPRSRASAHRPGRKAGGLVVLVDGALALYLERGGKSALAFTGDEAVLAAAARDLAATARARRLDTLTIEQVNGAFVYGTAVGRAAAGRRLRRVAARADAAALHGGDERAWQAQDRSGGACLRATPSTAPRDA